MPKSYQSPNIRANSSLLVHLRQAGILLFVGLALDNCTPTEKNESAAGTNTVQSPSTDTLQVNTLHPSQEEFNVDDVDKKAKVEFTPAQLELLKQGLVIANTSMQDTVFANVLRELAKANKIDWGNERLSAVNQRYWAAPTDYFLSQYTQRGLFQMTNLVAVKWTLTSATSSVVACRETMYVNVNALNRSAENVAGTYVHERAHAFCQKHNENNVSKNECDFAYQAGNLAWLLGLYRANQSKPVKRPNYVICSSLVDKLSKRKILK